MDPCCHLETETCTSSLPSKTENSYELANGKYLTVNLFYKAARARRIGRTSVSEFFLYLSNKLRSREYIHTRLLLTGGQGELNLG